MTGSDPDDPRYGRRERAYAQRGAAPVPSVRAGSGRPAEHRDRADHVAAGRGRFVDDGRAAEYGAPAEPPLRDFASPRLARSHLWPDAERGEGQITGSQPLRARWDPVPPPRVRVARRRSRVERRRSAIGWFLHHYGWRAYALPVLAALTVMAVVNLPGAGSDEGLESALPPAGDPGSVVTTVTMPNSVVTTVTIAGPGVTTTVDAPPTTAPSTGQTGPADDFSAAQVGDQLPPTPNIDRTTAFQGVVMGVLPAGQPFAQTGAGTYHVVPGTSEPFGSGADHRTFTVEVEDGIQSVAADEKFADAVVEILSSPTSWIGTGKFMLQRVDSGQPDFRISLTSQMTARQAGYCGWDVQLEASCYNSAIGRVVINDARWIRGAYSYNGDLTSYRVYAINHEVGHALGYNHEGCPTNGGLAPVMMQQSWSTADDDVARLNGGGPVPADGKICRANPFVTAP